jgi:signal transduction histidine kinase
LDVTRISTQSLKLNKEKFNLNNVILQLIDEFGNQIDNGRVTLIFSRSEEEKENRGKAEDMKKAEDQLPNDTFVICDKSRITQVISNLLSNAIKFTNEGFIEISIKREQAFNNHHNIGGNVSSGSNLIQKEQRQDISSTSSFIIVSVKDSGRGLDPDLIPRLFTKFATNSDQGVGLGLYISKNIIEAHGGKIWAENNKDQRGSTFSFTLPLS